METMKFKVKHSIRGRIRIHVIQSHPMTFEEADLLLYDLDHASHVTQAKVYDRTSDVVIYYTGTREEIISHLRSFYYEDVEVPEGMSLDSGRELSHGFEDRLLSQAAFHYMRKWFLPAPLAACYTCIASLKYIAKGIKSLWNRKIEVSVLDAAAIGVSVIRGNYSTASSVMFLLGVGELLEEWTHKKSVDDLARTLSLNVSKVWVKSSGGNVLMSIDQVKTGDTILVHMGNVIPFDGTVTEGEAMVNQSSLTGESVPVRRASGNTVYAGTVVEEGELTIQVNETSGSSRFEKIVKMIEETEKLKSTLESKAEHLADKLVPYTLGGTVLAYLLTRNTTKALSVLMVDFSCALKLAMPVSVLSAIREASQYHITVKGGRFLEAVAEADTIVFDKTGTLTKAMPTVAQVVSFNGDDPDELLRIAACLEEHFPHSMAKAVVDAAEKKGLLHEEMHAKVEYVVAHGISTSIGGKRTIIGSYHFVFEDEDCKIPAGKEELFKKLPSEYSHLYLAIENTLVAVICIEDPLREEASDVVRALKKAGMKKIVMMTGDSERTAKVIAEKVGVDSYFSEVLPEDKAGFVEAEKETGRKVIMIGDGINDSPALSAADAGIVLNDGAEIAKEIADIMIGSDDLYQVVTLLQISKELMKRIRGNYRFIVGFNTGLIGLGVTGVIQPTTSALLHNTSTLAIGLRSMKNLLP